MIQKPFEICWDSQNPENQWTLSTKNFDGEHHLFPSFSLTTIHSNVNY